MTDTATDYAADTVECHDCDGWGRYELDTDYGTAQVRCELCSGTGSLKAQR